MAGGYSLFYPNMRPRKVEFSFPIKGAALAVSAVLNMEPLNSSMKLRQNGTVSFSIRLAAFQARGAAHMKLHLIQCHLGCN